MHVTLLTAFLSFVQGYVGLPLLFFLVLPITRTILKPWGSSARLSEFLCGFFSFCFLLMVEFAVLDVWLDLLSKEHPETRQELGRLAGLFVFIGLVSFGITPKIELKIRSIWGKKKL